MTATNLYAAVEEFKKKLKVGDWFYIPLEHLAIMEGAPLPDQMIYEVKELYPHVVLLDHPGPKGESCKQSLSYVNLFMYGEAM